MFNIQLRTESVHWRRHDWASNIEPVLEVNHFLPLRGILGVYTVEHRSSKESSWTPMSKLIRLFHTVDENTISLHMVESLNLENKIQGRACMQFQYNLTR